MPSKRTLKKMVKNSSRLPGLEYVSFKVLDDNEEEGDHRFWCTKTVKFSRLCIIDTYNGIGIEAVPYWKVHKPFITDNPDND